MSIDIQTMIVIFIVLASLIYVLYRASKKFCSKKSGCDGCGKCGH